MKTPGYELRKGDYIKIPYPPKHPELESVNQQPQMPTKPVVVERDMRNREIRVGVMLPLHNENGDGKRMVEYYRGVLMHLYRYTCMELSREYRYKTDSERP